METGCWVLGGEFEDSVFEQKPERQPEPPSSYGAKLCEPQVRRLSSCHSSPEPAAARSATVTVQPPCSLRLASHLTLRASGCLSCRPAGASIINLAAAPSPAQVVHSSILAGLLAA